MLQVYYSRNMQAACGYGDCPAHKEYAELYHKYGLDVLEAGQVAWAITANYKAVLEADRNGREIDIYYLPTQANDNSGLLAQTIKAALPDAQMSYVDGTIVAEV